MSFEYLRAQFPVLDCTVNGKPLVYLDSAATALKPRSVIDRMQEHYLYESSNVHRGLHFLSDQATRYFEDAREKVAEFIDAPKSSDVIFTSGTTDSINKVAQSYRKKLGKKDVVLVSELEHHSNFVPWQQLCLETGSEFRVFEVAPDGSFSWELFEKSLDKNVKIVAVSSVSNAIGVELPIRKIADAAHAVGAVLLVDAAQSVAHQDVNVQELDCDFLCFSAHKLFGPTGIGALYTRTSVQAEMPPTVFGGGMVDVVTWSQTTFQDPPFKFEAGTPHIAGAIGFSAAVDFTIELGWRNVQEHEHRLGTVARSLLSRIPQVQVYGPAESHSSILSFLVKGAHPSDVGTLLDQEGVAVRAGHHCTQPLMKKFGIPGTVRASFSIYNSRADAERFAEAVQKAVGILGIT